MSDGTERVGEFFDDYARTFDSIYEEERRGPFERLTDRLFRGVMVARYEETLRRTANPDIHSILDVGCGGGRYSVAFLEQGKEVVGVDLAPEMLRLARLAAEQQDNPNWDFVEGDFLALDTGRTFDAACLMGYFDYIGDPVAHLSKLAEIVTGEFYASFPMDGGLLGFQRKIRYRMRNCPLWMYDRRGVEQHLADAGLLEVTDFVDLGRDLYVCVRTRDLG